MIDIDEIIKRKHKNPYESETKPEYRCANCGEGIFYSDDYYVLQGNVYCVACVERKTC